MMKNITKAVTLFRRDTAEAVERMKMSDAAIALF